MKNFIFLLLFSASFIVNGQIVQQRSGNAQDIRNNTYDIQYLGKSTWTIHKESITGFVRLKKLRERGINSIEQWTNSINAKYKVINVDNVKAGMGITPKVTITFILLNHNGSVWLTREDAIEKLKESKELLDLGLLSEDDFNKTRQELAPLIK
jgi:hypothetical protein|tara:strand:+ start:286 stop:744 length:459 start_codon:yes stop_codon:yes gene_type:complete